jgi:RNA polymerase sigma-70 factor (ECF subfamily)
LHPRYSFDAEYVRRLRQGDAATEDHFFEYFGELVRVKAAGRLRSNKQAAEDIRQETLLRVLRRVREGAIEHPERFGAYVNSVCNNVMLELFRRDRRLNQFPEDAPDVASGEPGTEVGLLEAERKALVRRALGELAPKDQELLRRIFLEEHDKDRVCEEFQVSREYLRVLLHRARGRLRTAMDRGRRRTAGAEGT